MKLHQSDSSDNCGYNQRCRHDHNITDSLYCHRFDCAGGRASCTQCCICGICRERLYQYRNFHTPKTKPITYEIIPLGLVQGYEVFAGSPISGISIHGAVIIPRFVHLKHIVGVFLVPECCINACGSIQLELN